MSDAEELEACYFDFTVNRTSFGENIVEELKKGGTTIDVNMDNRAEYLDLYIKYILSG